MPGNLAQIPLSVVASWPTPNYEHPPEQRTWLVPVAIVIHVLVTIMVVIRLGLRLAKKSGPPGIDDALIIPAYIFSTMFTVLTVIGVLYYGFDRHNWDVYPSDFEPSALIGWLAEIAFLLSTGSTKVSVLLFYRRLADGTMAKHWKAAVIAVIAFIILYGVSSVLILIFMCDPISAYWRAFDIEHPISYHCLTIPACNLVVGIFSVLTDLFAVILPIAMLRNFDIPRKQRLALNALFSLGLLTCIIGGIRTWAHSRLGYEYDLSWLAYSALFWSLLEMQLSLMCATAPAVRSFIRMYVTGTNTVRGESPGSLPPSYRSASAGDNASSTRSRWSKALEMAMEKIAEGPEGGKGGGVVEMVAFEEEEEEGRGRDVEPWLSHD